MIEPFVKVPGLSQPYFRVLDVTEHFRLPRSVTISYTPDQVAGLYGFPVQISGPDMTIAVISLGGGYRTSDISGAFSAWHLPQPQVTNVSIQGATNQPGSDADVENLLDIQISAACYSYCTNKAAHVRFYSAPNTDSGFAAAVQQAANDGCATVSISWGSAEVNWGQQACQMFDQVCNAAKTAGATIFAASGDNLSGDGAPGNNTDFPSSSPSVVGCGGTNKTPNSETVWNEGGGGTGGGFSKFFARPTWQIGAPSSPARMVPDVAGDAAPSTGWKIMSNGSFMVVGGTSAVSPMYAGLFAAIASAAGKRLGDILPMLWSHPAVFSDVVSGSNGQWRAGVGPDACTGLGVPIGTKLLSLFVTQPPIPPVPPVPPPGTDWTINRDLKVPIRVVVKGHGDKTDVTSISLGNLPAAELPDGDIAAPEHV